MKSLTSPPKQNYLKQYLQSYLISDVKHYMPLVKVTQESLQNNNNTVKHTENSWIYYIISITGWSS